MLRPTRADNFKPESVDPTKPGSIEIKKAKEEGGPSSVNVTRPSTQVCCGRLRQTLQGSYDVQRRMRPVSTTLAKNGRRET